MAAGSERAGEVRGSIVTWTGVGSNIEFGGISVFVKKFHHVRSPWVFLGVYECFTVFFSVTCLYLTDDPEAC